MLDTDIVSAILKSPDGTAAEVLKRVAPQNEIGVSIITAAELRYGTAKKGSAKLLRNVERLLSALEIYPLLSPADMHYGGIRSELESAGQAIGPNDLLIAAHAIAIGAVLVTANGKEFARVRGLEIQNWLDP